MSPERPASHTRRTDARGADRPIRLSWRLSRAGTVAACTVIPVAAPAYLEIRSGSGVKTVVIEGLSAHSQLLPLDDGSLWLCHHRRGEHQLDLLVSGGAVSRVATSPAQSFSLLPGPEYPVVIEVSADCITTIHRAEPSGLIPLITFPGRAMGGVWLNDDQTSLAVNIAGVEGYCSAVSITLPAGEVQEFFSVTPTSDDTIVDYVPRANLVVVSTNAGGQTRLGYGRPGTDPVRFPDTLRCTGAVGHLASSTDGSMIAVGIEEGAATRVRLISTADGTFRDLDLPALVTIGRAHLGATFLTVPVSMPGVAGTLLRIAIDTGQLSGDPPITSRTPAQLTRIPSNDGTIETIIVGNPSRSDTVVIALHGGPLDAWRAGYDPLVEALSAGGISVVAPNIRGSVGYGRAHALAIKGCWGGPDLDDVVAVINEVVRCRPAGAQRPILVGSSYGGYLALLAAAKVARQVAGCVAIASFVSGARVIDSGGPVAEVARRLGGDVSPDLREQLSTITAPVLLLHGQQDDVVPASESRLIAATLRAQRKPVIHIEIAGAGHDLAGSRQRSAVLEQVLEFCREPPPISTPLSLSETA